MNRSRSVMMYCQHSVGIGHLIRSFRLAAAIAESAKVTLLCGGRIPHALKPPARVNLVQLPPVALGPDGRTLVCQDERFSIEEASARRRSILAETFERQSPDALITEYFPFGRLQFAAELLPLLHLARRRRHGGPFIACSVRDLLERAGTDAGLSDGLAVTTLKRFYDAVFIHADPALARFESTFGGEFPVGVDVHYTGYVTAQNVRSKAAAAEPRILVSVGGGRMGAPLLWAAARCFLEHGFGEGLSALLVAGQDLPATDWRGLSKLAGHPGLTLRRWVDNLGEELNDSRASVSMGGYNSMLDVLQSGIPALIVPFTNRSNTEQMRRTQLLEACGYARILSQENCTPERLAAEIPALLRFRPRPLSLDMNGAQKTQDLLIKALDARRHYMV